MVQRVISYTKEELVEALKSGEKLANVKFYGDSFERRKVVVNKVTEKSILLEGGGYARRSFSDIGHVDYSGFYCLEKDITRCVEEYRRQAIQEHELIIKNAQESLAKLKSAKYRGLE